jgi:hypothetical protein
MGFDLESDDDYALRRMESLENRYRRAQFILRGAQMQYNTLRDIPGTTNEQLAQGIYRIRRAREQVEDILSTIEFLEDQHYSAIAVRRVG